VEKSYFGRGLTLVKKFKIDFNIVGAIRNMIINSISAGLKVYHLAG
jgi:hypothetical protein